MKKKLLLFILVIVSITSCKRDGAPATKLKRKNAVEKTIDEQVKKMEGNSSKATSGSGSSSSGGSGQIVTQNGSVLGDTSDFEAMLKDAKNQNGKDGIDYDLTTMGKDMVYATVYLLMTEPDSFEGKKIKMKGQYLSAYYKPNKKYYNYCFISDAAGCCSQGIEFATKENLKYPDDFPEDSTDIEVVGVFETYMEGGKMYCHLKDSKMTILKEE